jgi:hypothetical protein
MCDDSTTIESSVAVRVMLLNAPRDIQSSSGASGGRRQIE